MRAEKLTISRLATRGAVGIETVRYYHRIGLLPIPKATKTKFREYDQSHLQQLHFIRNAKIAGFSLKEIKLLLKYNPVKERLSIQALAKAQLEKLQTEITALKKVERGLKKLISHCENSREGSHCSIIASFS